jgi:D-ribose pyranose/furanose isomerase RbsD
MTGLAIPSARQRCDAAIDSGKMEVAESTHKIIAEMKVVEKPVPTDEKRRNVPKSRLSLVRAVLRLVQREPEMLNASVKGLVIIRDIQL